jgi:DNA polymerase III delta prime subunit
MLSFVQQIAQKVKDNIACVIIGKDDVVELLLIALSCEGHVLLEDVPGIGKTTLAKSLARFVANRPRFSLRRTCRRATAPYQFHRPAPSKHCESGKPSCERMARMAYTSVIRMEEVNRVEHNARIGRQGHPSAGI